MQRVYSLNSRTGSTDWPRRRSSVESAAGDQRRRNRNRPLHSRCAPALFRKDVERRPAGRRARRCGRRRRSARFQLRLNRIPSAFLLTVGRRGRVPVRQGVGPLYRVAFPATVGIGGEIGHQLAILDLNR